MQPKFMEAGDSSRPTSLRRTEASGALTKNLGSRREARPRETKGKISRWSHGWLHVKAKASRKERRGSGAPAALAGKTHAKSSSTAPNTVAAPTTRRRRASESTGGSAWMKLDIFVRLLSISFSTFAAASAWQGGVPRGCDREQQRTRVQTLGAIAGHITQAEPFGQSKR